MVLSLHEHCWGDTPWRKSLAKQLTHICLCVHTHPHTHPQIDSMYNDFEGKVVLDLGTGTVSRENGHASRVTAHGGSQESMTRSTAAAVAGGVVRHACWHVDTQLS